MHLSTKFVVRVALATVAIAIAVMLSAPSRPAQTITGAVGKRSPAQSAASLETNLPEPAWMMWLPLTADGQ